MDDTNKKNHYNPSEIEAKWQEKWEEDKTFSPDVSQSKNPYYNLMMFPYPSAEGLHVGNMYAFTGADVYAKFQRMQGKDVLEPIGLDGFGIHSENYALKIGVHPKEQAQIAEKNFYRQLRSIGNSFDWQRTVETYNPNYYKWTQWLFIQLFKAGLAYRASALVNWCPSCKTVLSDEQVLQKSKIKSQISNSIELTLGVCERCGTEVEKKNLEQWFFKITDYADRLLDGLDNIDWTERVKIAQRNWIGKSEGAEIRFQITADRLQNDQKSEIGNQLTVFTTRPDTLFGATFMVLSPEHELVEQMVNGKWEMANVDEVKKYVEEAKGKTDIERGGEGKEKTGVFSGLYAINPVNGTEIPIWIADYVLAGYGTGAIMAVPAHDERDYQFATKYNLPILPVILTPSAGRVELEAKQSDEIATSSSTPRNDETLYVGSGKLINSGEWDGISVPKEMFKVLESLEEKGLGTRKANFHLRDWLISRQRYWGPPIPLVFCANCADKIKNQKANIKEGEYSKGELENPGWIAVKEDNLPVELPDVEDWKPMGTGKSPLANHPEFYKTTCPSCGGEAERETDVSDTFLDSSWYFLRYPSVEISNIKSQISNNISKDKETDQIGSNSQNTEISNLKSDLPFDPEITTRWLPVDQYIGGAEHSVLHLLYSRFVTMVLKDLHFIDFEEPFTKFFAHGLIIKDGAKMSKSKGNVVVPDEYISKYGADTLRSYLMFIGPYSDGGDFRDTGIEGMYRFLRKVWKFLSSKSELNEISLDRVRFMHKTIKKVTEDIATFSYNTSIASLMEWYNFLNKELIETSVVLNKEERGIFLHLLAPFAPHMAEELWQQGDIREDKSEFFSIHLSKWPQYEEKYLVSDSIVIPVQINGKRRGEITVSSQQTADSVQIEELAREAVAKNLEGLTIKKTIYVTGKIVNFVV